MCVYSMVLDYGRWRVPQNEWNWENWQKYQELIRKAEEFDKAAKQPDCEDEEKKKWMNEVEERLRKLEGPQPAPAVNVNIDAESIADSVKKLVDAEVAKVLTGRCLMSESVKIPATLQECVSTLFDGLGEEEKEIIRTRPADSFHHGYGTGLRNAWDLWNRASPLSRWFQKELGIAHGDDLSGTIIAALCAKVKNEPFNAWEHVKKYKEHWLMMGLDPIDQNPATTDRLKEAWRETSK